ncbi:MAG TPA: DUF3182 family protein [Ancylobacter sp.]
MDTSAADRQHTDIASAPWRVAPVVFVPADSTGRNHRQEGVRALARRIARLRGSDCIEAPTGALPHGGYAVPTETLVGHLLAGRLGIQSEEDLFGGLVPYAVLAGKAITHDLVNADALRPEGWSPAFSDAVHGVTLRGTSVFDRRSAAQAGRALLATGPIRLKPAWADGGHCQHVFDDVGALDAALEAMDANELQSLGLVVEEDLHESTVYSIGRLRLGNRVFAYFGHQETTRDNCGQTAYGGSTLTVFPGDLDELLDRPMEAPVRQAVEYARAYDHAALRHLPGLIASRRNYDIIAGLGARGDPRLGVLEQSWRIGGASGAEIAAVEAFHADPALACVRASCAERYGARHEAPEDSIVYFHADDPEVGPLIKYARIEARHRAL